jgi:hypothetical protein
MAASTIPSAKAALLAEILARPALIDVHVAWGIPAELPTDLERIYVGDAVDVSREWAGLGGARLNEDYVLQVFVETFAGGDDQQTVELRLWTMIAEIEAAVRADNRLGGLVFVIKPDRVDAKTLPTDSGWAASATMRFAVEARM